MKECPKNVNKRHNWVLQIKDILHYILDQTNYYALFIIVLLTLNWNYSEVFVPHFTVVI